MRKLYYTPKIIRLITFHLRLRCARTSTTKWNEPMPRGWKRQAVVIVVKKHGDVPFHTKILHNNRKCGVWDNHECYKLEHVCIH
jgi:hypothetical protein